MILRGTRRQNGITGLETAIVLIAFVVVASVFAFTILSAGAFSGYVGNTQAVHKLVFIVSNSLAGESGDLTAHYTTDDPSTDPDIVVGANTMTTISYADENQRMSDVPWTVSFIGNNNSDSLL